MLKETVVIGEFELCKDFPQILFAAVNYWDFCVCILRCRVKNLISCLKLWHSGKSQTHLLCRGRANPQATFFLFFFDWGYGVVVLLAWCFFSIPPVQGLKCCCWCATVIEEKHRVLLSSLWQNISNLTNWFLKNLCCFNSTSALDLGWYNLCIYIFFLFLLFPCFFCLFFPSSV